MEQVLSTIILSLPGFMVMHWVERMGRSRTTALTDFERTIYSLLLNVPVLLCNWLVLLGVSKWFPYFRIVGLTVLYKRMDNILFLLGYAVLSIIIAWSISLIISSLQGRKELYERLNLVNAVRRKNGLPGLNNGTVWDKFAEPGKAKVVKVYKIGDPDKAIWGVLSDKSNPGSNENAMLLVGTKNVESYKHLLQKVIKSYVDIGTGTVVEEYDQTEMRQHVAQQTGAQGIAP